MSAKATADRHQRQLLVLLKEPGNDHCADCKARNPRWASWDQGVFLCVGCASMHRKIGAHITKVKSVTLDTWTREQVDSMRQKGNRRVNAQLNPDERRHPPPPPDSGDERNSELERFIRNKYEYRAFANSHPDPLPAYAAPPTEANHSAAPSALPSMSYTPPPGESSAPPLPSRPRSRTAPTLPDFTAAAAANSLPPPSLPPRPSTSAPVMGLKSVRFPDQPPTIIPSPEDSDEEEEDDTLPRVRARSASAPPPRKGVLRFRSGSGSEIRVDWAAFTRDSSLDPSAEDEDVPLGTLGALGARGAQVGMVGLPQAQAQAQMHDASAAWAVPYGQPGAATGLGAPAFPHGQGGAGAGAPTVAPLLPQYTGSAKGYLHQQRATQQSGPEPLQPQTTGFDAFQQMFQPRQGPAAGSNPFLQQQQQQQSASSQPQWQEMSNGIQSQPPPPPPTFAQPQPHANPFYSHLFNRNAYSPSPQPPTLQPQPPNTAPPPPPPPPRGPGADIWADLDLLSLGGPPQPAFHGYASGARNPSTPSPPLLGGGGVAPVPSPSSFGAPSPLFPPPPALPPRQATDSPSAPAPLRPQRTGFVPSSEFGQQLARETGAGSSGGSLSTLQIPTLTSGTNGGGGSGTSTPLFSAGSGPPSPAPFAAAAAPAPSPTVPRLEPQRTGFVPSSAFGQELFRTGWGGAGGGGGGEGQHHAQPAPLRPQLTGFVPSSSFGLQLATNGAGAAGGPGAGTGSVGPTIEPAPFDVPPGGPGPAPPPPHNPFANLGGGGGGTTRDSRGAGSSPNPFFLRPQTTGFGGGSQMHSAAASSSSFGGHGGGGTSSPSPAPQNSWGGAGGGGGGGWGGNPFWGLQPQQAQQSGGWR